MLSDQLRKKAVREGLSIDDVFRNTNGMHFYLSYAEYLFTDGRRGHYKVSKDVVRMYALYRENPAAYQEILREAHSMIGEAVSEEILPSVDAGKPAGRPEDPYKKGSNTDRKVNQVENLSKAVQEHFFAWLSRQVKPAQLSELYHCYERLDRFCLYRKILRKPVFETIDVTQLNRAYAELEKSKLFRMEYRSQITLSGLRHYVRFVRENQDALQALKDGKAVPGRKPENTKQSPKDEPIAEAKSVDVVLDLMEKLRLFNGEAGQTPQDKPKEVPAKPEATQSPQTSVDSIPAAEETAPDDKGELLTVDFSVEGRYSFTAPVSIRYLGILYPVSDWRQAYIQILACLANDFPDRFMRLRGKTIASRNVLLFGDERMAADMRKPLPIPGTGLHAETGFNANNLVRLMGMLLRSFAVNPKRVVIQYRRTAPGGLTESAPTAVDTPVETSVAASAETPVEASVDMPSETAVETPQEHIVSAEPADLSEPDGLTVQGDAAPAVFHNRRTAEETKAQFQAWMQNQGLFSGISAVYANCLERCSHYALAHGFSKVQFYDMSDVDEVRDCFNDLLRDTEFLRWNAFDSKLSKTAILKYLKFLQEKPDGNGTSPSASDAGAQELPTGSAPEPHNSTAADTRWQRLLEEVFPNGYILNDFLCQLQASGEWQQRYGEDCPLQGTALDAAISVCGSVRGGRVYPSNGETDRLIDEICMAVADYLTHYSCAYVNSVHECYRDALAAASIYTEEAMSTLLLKKAAGRFRRSSNCFIRTNGWGSIQEDCRSILRSRGGGVAVTEVARELRFVPYDSVYHAMTVDEECLNVGTGTWMLVEHFPLTVEDARKIGDMLDECFLSREYVMNDELLPLIQRNLPYIGENLSALSCGALFNILWYHLQKRFSFSKSLISPKGMQLDNKLLFQSFVRDRERFTMSDLDAFAQELHVPVYWEDVYAGGAVRVSSDEFVNRSAILFDVDAIDRALEGICPGDLLPFAAVSDGMLLHLPSCGYAWNAYLLQSYVNGYSITFRMLCNSLSKTGAYGAMVRRSRKDLDNYPRLVEEVLSHACDWNTSGDALELLVKRGYQANRKLKGIEDIVGRARKNRLKNEE